MYYAYKQEPVPLPENNLAPFRETVDPKGQSLYLIDAKDKRSLTDAHLSDSELKTWINTIVSQALTINNKDYYNALFQIDTHFTDEGFNQYEDYLKNAKVFDFVQEGQYALNVIVEEPPLSLNSGSVDGAYRWLYQLPITVTYQPVAASSGKVVNQKLLLRLQLSRVFYAGDRNKIRIESWNISAR